MQIRFTGNFMDLLPWLITILGILVAAAIWFAVKTNKQLIDTSQEYTRAIIKFPNGAILDGPVDSWRNYRSNDQIKVTIDGKPYLVHSSNIVLIKEI